MFTRESMVKRQLTKQKSRKPHINEKVFSRDIIISISHKTTIKVNHNGAK